MGGAASTSSPKAKGAAHLVTDAHAAHGAPVAAAAGHDNNGTLITGEYKILEDHHRRGESIQKV
jgi:hypothetical protein